MSAATEQGTAWSVTWTDLVKRYVHPDCATAALDRADATGWTVVSTVAGVLELTRLGNGRYTVTDATTRPCPEPCDKCGAPCANGKGHGGYGHRCSAHNWR